MNLKFYKIYPIFSCLLLIVFLLEGCLGEPTEQEMAKDRQRVEKAARETLARIEPLEGIYEKHLTKLEEYIVANNLSTSSNSLSITTSSHANIPSATASINSVIPGIVQQRPLLKIKEKKGKEKEEEELEKEEIKHSITAEADVNRTDKKGNSPLHIAINQASTELAAHLSATKLDYIHSEDIDHLGQDKLQHLILKSIKNGLIHQAKEAVELLLKQKANVNVTDENANTPLHLAAEKGYLEIVELLLKSGANVKAKNTKSNTPLHVAAKNGHIDIVKLLIGRGATIDVVNKDKRMPILLAARNGHVEVVQFLIEKRADYRAPDKRENTILHHAVKARSLGIVDLLLNRGFKRDTKNEKIITPDKQNKFSTYKVSGKTPLQLAVKKGCVEITKLLVAHGASLKTLVEDQPTYDSKGIDQDNTLLHIAVQKGCVEIIRFLVLEKKLNVNAKNYWEFTPLHFAARNGCLDIVKLLVENGADVEAKSSSYYNTSTPLSLAIVNGHLDVADFLIEQGATLTEKMRAVLDIQKKNNSYSAPLHFVAENDDTELASLLIRYGADVNAKDKDGNTPIDLATKKGFLEMVKLLEKTIQPVFMEKVKTQRGWKGF
jgi:ankyrin repeat protein